MEETAQKLRNTAVSNFGKRLLAHTEPRYSFACFADLVYFVSCISFANVYECCISQGLLPHSDFSFQLLHMDYLFWA
jgi:hypothetical protein